MATVLFFGPLADLAHCRHDELAGRTVSQLVEAAQHRYGERFAAALVSCAIWVNGEPAGLDVVVSELDEVAFLPPVSGG